MDFSNLDSEPFVWTDFSYDKVYTSRYGDIAPNEQSYQQHKDNYRQQRDAFLADPRALPELEAWRKRDNDYDYQLLYEYNVHNAPHLILSESEHSYIIGNKASYDGRQYPLPPNAKRPEGQGYCHTLVIPKTRIYNVVDPLATENDCFVLKELYEHFQRFWLANSSINRRLILHRARKALDERDTALVNGKTPRPPEYTDSVRNAIFADFERMQYDFQVLKISDFLFGFHVFPDNSIGHLHMHVFPHNSRFREYSTRTYDHKTVPLQAILDVEAEDASSVNGLYAHNGGEASSYEVGGPSWGLSPNGEGSSNWNAASMLDAPFEAEASEEMPSGAIQWNSGTSSPDIYIPGSFPMNR
ncbi:MAG: hypothetical protein Q9180_006627 [Flavoplaca navasiana]